MTEKENPMNIAIDIWDKTDPFVTSTMSKASYLVGCCEGIKYSRNHESPSEAWVSVETPPDNMIAVIVAGQYGNRIITCSDTAYYDKTKGRWFDHSNDMMLAEGFLKFYQPLPQPPIK